MALGILRCGRKPVPSISYKVDGKPNNLLVLELDLPNDELTVTASPSARALVSIEKAARDFNERPRKAFGRASASILAHLEGMLQGSSKLQGPPLNLPVSAVLVDAESYTSGACFDGHVVISVRVIRLQVKFRRLRYIQNKAKGGDWGGARPWFHEPALKPLPKVVLACLAPTRTFRIIKTFRFLNSISAS
jgi:hypothetical protein